MKKAFIFDMDGVIIDSEPLWKKAMIGILEKYGLTLSETKCAETTGMRILEVVTLWNNRLTFTNDVAAVANEIEDALCILIKKEGRKMPGFDSLISLLSKKNILIALATSSSPKVINCVLDSLSIRNYFKQVQSAHSLDFGKPHPQVFLETARALDISPESCVVVEDSIHGVIAARAAKMKVIAIPFPIPENPSKFGIAHYTLSSLNDITPALLDKILCQNEI